jgi:hypothetical protein
VFLAYAILLIGGVIVVICPRVVFARMKGELLENEHLLCLHCGYSLKGLPSEHVCPECGRPYSADTLRQAWRHWIEKRKLPEQPAQGSERA